jgi:recombination protein RecA
MAAKLTPTQVVARLRRKFAKQFGDGVAVTMGDGSSQRIKAVCPTGILPFDHHVLGCGGVPYGRIVEMSGAEGSGKDTLMDRILAGAQRDGALAALLETEHKWDPDWAKLHGVHLPDLVFSQPPYVEQAHLEIEELVRMSTPQRRVVIALDSVASTPTKKEVEEGMDGGAAVGEQGRLWSHFMRVMPGLVAKHQALLLLINQIRMKVGVMYGNPETTPGGLAIKFHSSFRLTTYHGKKDGPSARFMSVQALKNQTCPPMRKCSLRLDFHEGFDDDWAILDHAKEVGAVAAGCKNVKEAVKALGWEAYYRPTPKEETDDDGSADQTSSP